ncbi:subtilisin-like protein [Macrolepiota fuliginosa MF-IS2]|uniref:tripeptidyl-peptidase II n=1 Tax=Macrolepiota fuliginosa MF-IS2 TaxID=1400762 RepID=A0A9P5XHV4_9AGAR|nr:subtilisin-like protein [Macrolepiota fuliginosa MF-IS2]
MTTVSASPTSARAVSNTLHLRTTSIPTSPQRDSRRRSALFTMKLFTSCVLALALVSGALALPQPEIDYNFRLKESIVPPHGWQKISTAPADHIIHLRIGLPQSNFKELERHLYEVSDPFHSRYGQHLSKAEVDALVAPPKQSHNLVDEWLTSFGLGEEDLVRSSAQDWVTVKIPISVAEKMLNTKYHIWKYDGTDDHLIRTTDYSLPDHLHGHIELIQPTTIFARWNKMKATLHYDVGSLFKSSIKKVFSGNSHKADLLGSVPTVDPSCNATVTLSCLQQLYNFKDYRPQVPEKNSVGVSSYLEQFANLEDLKSFYLDQRPEAVNTTFELISVNGGLNNQTLVEAGVEANLDVQFAFGLSWPTRSVAFSTGGRPPFKPDHNTPENTNEPYADWLDYVLSHEDKLPLAISTSYGEAEQTIPEAYARRVCNDIAKLGALGTSVLFSSGDGGVGDGNPNPETQTCLTNDGRNVTRFMPTFPATCPYSTAVGGTNNVPEIAVFFSGGGFSDYFEQPTYQSHAVQKYLSALPKGAYEGLFNKQGRAFPDVAALGRRFRVWWKGNPISVGGTSASAPTFAAVVALLNDVRLAEGKRPLGFLNPWLYSLGAIGLNDITVGNNPGCGTPGFNATAGWDPVTGLGTPDFGKLRKVLPRY